MGKVVSVAKWAFVLALSAKAHAAGFASEGSNRQAVVAGDASVERTGEEADLVSDAGSLGARSAGRDEPRGGRPVSLHVVIPDCSEGPLAHGDVLTALRTEIGAFDVVDRALPLAPWATTIVIASASCDSKEPIVQVVLYPIGKPRVERSVRLGTLDQTTLARLVAVAASEMMHAEESVADDGASAPDMSKAKEDTVPPEPPSLPRVSRGARETARSSAQAGGGLLFAEGGLRSYPAYSPVVFEGCLGWRWDVSSAVSLGASGGYLTGTDRVSSGTVHWRGFFGSIFALAPVSATHGVFVGPKLDMGSMRARGDSANVLVATRQVDHLFVQATAMATASARVFGPLRTGLSLEAGWVLDGMETLADGERVGGVSGFVGSVRLGVGWSTGHVSKLRSGGGGTESSQKRPMPDLD